MTLILRAATATDVGRVRTNNEDSAFAGRRLVVVADGIGGLPAGELASDIAIRALAPLDQAELDDPLPSLRRAVEAANRRIMEIAERDPATEGMGTTVTALLLAGSGLGLAHVGDSRAYRLRGGVLSQVTKDDTFVQTLVDEGYLTPADARVHPRRSLVTQAVQGHDFTGTYELLTPRAGDRFLICSDGLSDVVSDEEITAHLRGHPDRRRCAEALVAAALAAGGPDNVTVIVADLDSA
jgi:serine/threonine protein phosphatase PrpC